jgi:hypothetical protein
MGFVVDVKARACCRALTALNVAWRLRSIVGRAIVGAWVLGNLAEKTQKKEREGELFGFQRRQGREIEKI